MGDDAFGVLVAKELEGMAGADLLLLDEGGLDVAVNLISYSNILIIDAIESKDGKVGDIVELSVEALSETKGLSGHAMTLAEALEALSLLSGEAPREVRILACRIRPVETYGESVTPKVAEAAKLCARMAERWVRTGSIR